MATGAVRKLIDIREPVFNVLSVNARRQGVSLKKYIENLLEAEVAKSTDGIPDRITDSRVISLIGVARNIGLQDKEIEEERLKYLLSK